MHVYFTSSNQVDAFKKGQPELPHFVWENITFGDWDESRTIDLDIKLPEVSAILVGNVVLCAHQVVVSRCNIMGLFTRIYSSQGMVHIPTRQILGLRGV